MMQSFSPALAVNDQFRRQLERLRTLRGGDQPPTMANAFREVERKRESPAGRGGAADSLGSYPYWQAANKRGWAGAESHLKELK